MACVFMVMAWMPQQALAHIKWFAHVRVADAPRAPWNVMGDPAFVGLALAASAAMMLVGCIEFALQRSQRAGRPASRFLTPNASEASMRIVQWGIGAFFAANALYFAHGPVILTPELTSHAAWTTFLQWVVVVACFSRLPSVAAMALMGLYGRGIAEYGLFHMLDYVMFIGLAVCLWFNESDGRVRLRALAFLRVTLAWSLTWGAIEKWLFPQWTFPLLCGDARSLLMGLSPEFFMQGAGMVEFCSAFALLIGGVAGRVAAVALIALFVCAMPMFGVIDLVGHMPFVVALAALLLSPNLIAQSVRRSKLRQHASRWCAGYAALLLTMPLLYFSGHQWLLDWRDMAGLPSAALLPLMLPCGHALWHALSHRRWDAVDVLHMRLWSPVDMSTGKPSHSNRPAFEVPATGLIGASENSDHIGYANCGLSAA